MRVISLYVYVCVCVERRNVARGVRLMCHSLVAGMSCTTTSGPGSGDGGGTECRSRLRRCTAAAVRPDLPCGPPPSRAVEFAHGPRRYLSAAVRTDRARREGRDVGNDNRPSFLLFFSSVFSSPSPFVFFFQIFFRLLLSSSPYIYILYIHCTPSRSTENPLAPDRPLKAARHPAIYHAPPARSMFFI